MNRLKILAIAAAMVASAVIGGTLISVVAAHPSSPATSDDPAAVDSQAGAYCQTFLNEFAKQLGVDESALAPAAKAAADAVIDKAVADGKLTKEMADQLKQRIADADGKGCAFLGARWGNFLRHEVKAGIGKDLFQAAADALHLSTDQLKTKLMSGASLKQIAKDQNVDYGAFTTAVHNAAKADLDKLVSAGTITQDRENSILDRLDQALKDGRLGNGHFGFEGRPFRPFGGQVAPSADGSSS
jgi:polyhydroxyalkanoate synthesis regulator phasin